MKTDKTNQNPRRLAAFTMLILPVGVLAACDQPTASDDLADPQSDHSESSSGFIENEEPQTPPPEFQATLPDQRTLSVPVLTFYQGNNLGGAQETVYLANDEFSDTAGPDYWHRANLNAELQGNMGGFTMMPGCTLKTYENQNQSGGLKRTYTSGTNQLFVFNPYATRSFLLQCNNRRYHEAVLYSATDPNRNGGNHIYVWTSFYFKTDDANRVWTKNGIGAINFRNENDGSLAMLFSDVNHTPIDILFDDSNYTWTVFTHKIRDFDLVEFSTPASNCSPTGMCYTSATSCDSEAAEYSFYDSLVGCASEQDREEEMSYCTNDGWCMDPTSVY